MKLVIFYQGQLRTFDLVPDDEVYFQGNDMHPGYALREQDDFVIADCEYLGLHVSMSLYEGGEAAGSYTYPDGRFAWSWALLPENEQDNEHLRRMCSRVLYRETGIPL